MRIQFRFVDLLNRGTIQRPPCLKGAGKLPILGNLTGGYLCFLYPPAPSGHPPLGEGGFLNRSGNWDLLDKFYKLGHNAYIIGKGSEKKSTRRKTVREPCLVEMGTQETGEHGLGAGLSTGRQSRVRPLKRFEANTVIANQCAHWCGNLPVICKLRWYHGKFYRPCFCKGDFLF